MKKLFWMLLGAGLAVFLITRGRALVRRLTPQGIAEQVERKLAKGTPVMLEGRLVHRSYDGKDGVKRYATEIVLSDLKVIDFTMRKEALKTAV